MSDSAPRLLLLDSASLYFRAFYGVPARDPGPSGMPTNALAGFLDMIATLVTRYRPTHLAACWDDDWRPQWRVEAIPTYKSHRVAEDPAEGEEVPDELSPQVPVIAEALEVLGIARLGAAHYEADDVIGTLAHHYRGQMPIDVVTGDRDLFQLVDDASQTRVVYTARGGVRDSDLVDQAYLEQKYGVSTGDAYADMAVLRGEADIYLHTGGQYEWDNCAPAAVALAAGFHDPSTPRFAPTFVTSIKSAG